MRGPREASASFSALRRIRRIGRNDFDHPTSIAVGPEARLPFERLSMASAGLWSVAAVSTPRAGATQEELEALTGFRAVTVFRPNETVPEEFRTKIAGPRWRHLDWTAEERIAPFRERSTWHGLYREGELLL